MIHLKNFKQYTPESEEERSIQDEFSAMFFRAETGEDWYQTIDQFQSDTYKIKYDQNNIVVAFSQDASTICPISGSIIEVISIPDDLDLSGGWELNENNEIVRKVPTKEEYISQAAERRNSLMQLANESIQPLQDAVDLDMATEEETAKLKAWKIYRVKLSRVDTALAPEIEWPLAPNENPAQ